MLKIMIIDFIRHNPWGTSDYATHYYADGKRIKKNDYYRCYSVLDSWKWKYENSTQYTKVKDGITRNYTVIHYSKRHKD